MEKEEFIRYVIENILPKATYNEEKRKYELKYKDYEEYQLSTSQKKILKDICKKNNILLESKGYIRQSLTAYEDEFLFKEYNDIKQKLINPNQNNKDILEQRKINLRNKIVTDNIPFINSIISYRMTGINERKDKEDIYQLGYEILIKYIDNNYLIKGRFKDHISSILIHSIENKLIVTGDDLDLQTKNNLDIIKEQKDKNISIKELSKIMNLNKAQIKHLINLENILSATNIDNEYILSIPDKDYLEEITNDISIKTTIQNIISILSKEEQHIIKLYYGIGEKEHTITELSNIYGVSKSRISFLIISILDKIRSSILMKYLLEISNSNIKIETSDNYQNRRLEEFLIRNLDKELYQYIIKELNKSYQQFYQTFYQNKELSYKEISNILNKTESSINALRKKTTIEIRNIIINKLSIQYNKTITYEEYLDYLLKQYFKNNKIKRRVK